MLSQLSDPVSYFTEWCLVGLMLADIGEKKRYTELIHLWQQIESSLKGKVHPDTGSYLVLIRAAKWEKQMSEILSKFFIKKELIQFWSCCQTQNGNSVTHTEQMAEDPEREVIELPICVWLITTSRIYNFFMGWLLIYFLLLSILWKIWANLHITCTKYQKIITTGD